MEVFELPFDSRIFAPIRPTQLIKYKDAWIFFQGVGKYNYQVQQARLANPTLGVSYFRFTSNDDRSKYNLGIQLFLRQYPEYQYNLQAIIPEEV
jgi:hypothetical protein